MARALVLGATGHIGAHIVRALLNEGHEVRAAYRTERFLHVLQGLPVERIHVDLDTLNGLGEALDGCDWIFHAGAYYPASGERRDAAAARGVETTRRVLDRIRKAKPARLIFTSSSSTIRHVTGRLANEQDAEPWPISESRSRYAAVKIAIEREVERFFQEGLPVVMTNPSVCFGEYDARPFSGRAILAIARYRLPCYVEKSFDAIYTGDVGIGHVRAAERGRLGERYLLTYRRISVREFAGIIAKAIGVRPPCVRVPYGAVLAAATISEWIAAIAGREPLLPRQVIQAGREGEGLDGTKALRELGLPQTPIDEAIQRALSWFKEHRYL